MGDVDGCEVERFGSECVGEMDAQGRAADGEMDDLPDGCVTQVVGLHGVLWFGNLLRCAPGGNPQLRLCIGMSGGIGGNR